MCVGGGGGSCIYTGSDPLLAHCFEAESYLISRQLSILYSAYMSVTGTW